MFPILEEYLVTYRNLAAAEYNWRSVTWMKNEAKRITKNTKLFPLVQALMTTQEKELMAYFKCTRNYIYQIAVCIYSVE